MPVDELTMIWRIFLAGVLGLMIGLEREHHGRAAGLRTCILVSTASALVMSLSLHLAQMFTPDGGESIFRLDPARLPSYAIAGMGFLGAGAIVQGRSSARGITTGAAMWACTGVGLSVGAGLYWPSVVTVVLILAALILLRIPARRLVHEMVVSLVVETADPDTDDLVRNLLAEYDARLHFVGRECCISDRKITFRYSITIHTGHRWSEMLTRLEKVPGVVRYAWRPAEVP
jgi:putative Mg2+ transporter-C (MgtC) family protein